MTWVDRAPQAEHVTPAGTRRGWLQSMATRLHRHVTCLTYEALVPAPHTRRLHDVRHLCNRYIPESVSIRTDVANHV
jgi:hypothetical protein